MLRKINSNTNPRQNIRVRKKTRIRKKLARHAGSIPRLVVYRSNRFLYAQLVDDSKGVTISQANTGEESFKSGSKSRKNLATAKAVGLLIGKRAKESKIERVVFDRNGYDYHGRIQAIADGAREAGLKF